LVQDRDINVVDVQDIHNAAGDIEPRLETAINVWST